MPSINLRAIALVGLISLGSTVGLAQDHLYPFPAAVTYISSGTIYINAGTAAGLAAGDTVVVVHKPAHHFTLIIAAVSSGSSSAPFAGKYGDIAVGDSILVPNPIAKPEPQESPLAADSRWG